jgi:hypothetical protein
VRSIPRDLYLVSEKVSEGFARLPTTRLSDFRIQQSLLGVISLAFGYARWMVLTRMMVGDTIKGSDCKVNQPAVPYVYRKVSLLKRTWTASFGWTL